MRFTHLKKEWEKLFKENTDCWFRKTTHEIKNKSYLPVSITVTSPLAG